MLQKLPIGYSTLKKIIDQACVYIDKTHHIVKLVDRGSYYFLSRPRRFGKSLFLDTIKQAFLGNKALFTGLYIENHWDWSKKYPVIHIDFGAGVVQSKRELDQLVHSILDRHYRKHEIESLYSEGINIRFSYLIQALKARYNQEVVILIDEYDKPMLDNIIDTATATEIRESLKNLYGVIKSEDNNLRFVLLTGVSKFSKVSLFSGLNNLEDISIGQSFADICGYTQTELESGFSEYLKEVDLGKLKLWYNGYNFGGAIKDKVYNPFDILLFFQKGKVYRNYWFETATPTFLVKKLAKEAHKIIDYTTIEVSEDLLASFDIDSIPIVTLMFQTGYLTIDQAFELGGRLGYRLTYPNLEVKASIHSHLSRIGTSIEENSQNVSKLFHSLDQANWDQFKQVIQALFASIPHQWYRNNPISQYEGFYCSVVYSYLVSLAYETIAEDITSQGQIDLTLKMPKQTVILEFKIGTEDAANKALQQIKDKQYADKYLADRKPIYLIGIGFNSKERNVAGLCWEVVDEFG